MMFTFRLTTWVLFAAIVVMTLGPVSLRPHTHFSPDLDRFAAYAVLGVLFAVSYPPRRFRLFGAFLIAVAGTLEMAQALVPHRDPYFRDFLFKAGGAVIGLIAVRVTHLVVPVRHRRFPSSGIE